MAVGHIEKLNLEHLTRQAKARPILMKPVLVEASLWGLKHETRRPIKKNFFPMTELCPYGTPGDILWCREPVRLRTTGGDWYDVVYKGNQEVVHEFKGKPHPVLKTTGWTPSIHMPRAVCRLQLRIRKVSTPKLQSITEGQAKEEGYDYLCRFMDLNGARPWFRRLWDDIHEAQGLGWDENPAVWRIQFEVAHALQ